MIRKLSVLILIISMCLLISCGGRERAAERAVEEAIEKESGEKVDVDISGDSVKIRGEKIQMDMSKGEGEIKFKGEDGEEAKFAMSEKGVVDLPDGFPKDVYIYKGAAIKMSGKQEKSFMVTLETDDDMKRVVNEYKDKMKANGWEEAMSMDMGQQTMLQFKKEDRTTAITIATQDNKTTFHLIVDMGKE